MERRGRPCRDERAKAVLKALDEDREQRMKDKKGYSQALLKEWDEVHRLALLCKYGKAHVVRLMW